MARDGVSQRLVFAGESFRRRGLGLGLGGLGAEGLEFGEEGADGGFVGEGAVG